MDLKATNFTLFPLSFNPSNLTLFPLQHHQFCKPSIYLLPLFSLPSSKPPSKLHFHLQFPTFINVPPNPHPFPPNLSSPNQTHLRRFNLYLIPSCLLLPMGSHVFSFCACFSLLLSLTLMQQQQHLYPKQMGH